jgi:uncharacterized membrane protein YuzA (DUF378 family)
MEDIMITEGYKRSIHATSGGYYLRGFANILSIIGALNWGLIGSNNFNLVAYLFNPALSQIIYIAVGVSGIYLLMTLFTKRKI